MFGDLDWPLNESRGFSAIAEFLVFKPIVFHCNTRKVIDNVSCNDFSFDVAYAMHNHCLVTVFFTARRYA